MRDKVGIRGEFVAVVRRLSGELIGVWRSHNLITDAGKKAICDYLVGGSDGDFYQIGVGSDSTEPAASDTDLGSPLGWKTYTDRFRTQFSSVVVAFFGSGDANGTWAEAGLRNKAGTLIARGLFDPSFEKDSSMYVTVAWRITVS